MYLFNHLLSFSASFLFIFSLLFNSFLLNFSIS